MTTDREGGGFSLKRWSQRKLAAAREAATPLPAAPASGFTPDAAGAAQAVSVPTDSAPGGHTGQARPAADPAPLPPVESLTFDSDFAPFLRADVAETLKRQALKQLFRDPRFNAMDGLDVYIDDYSKPDPIAPEVVRELAQSRYLFDPPATRVNAEGVVEDVPVGEAAVPTPVTATASLTAPAQSPTGTAGPGAAPDAPASAVPPARPPADMLPGPDRADASPPGESSTRP